MGRSVSSTAISPCERPLAARLASLDGGKGMNEETIQEEPKSGDLFGRDLGMSKCEPVAMPWVVFGMRK